MIDDELDDDDRALLVRVKALRDRGVEPAWDQFEREVARQVDAEEARRQRSWWRRLWKPAFGLTLAGAAVAALLIAIDDDDAGPPGIAATEADAAAPAPPTPEPRRDVEVDQPLVLGDGELESAELAELGDDALDEVLAELTGEADDDSLAEWTEWDELPEDGLVPDLDLEWVDTLEDEELEAVARWLDEEAG